MNTRSNGSLAAGVEEQRQRAIRMRAWLIERGYDALIAVRAPRGTSRKSGRNYTELEVVDLR